MARTDPQLNFRIPAELKERLEAASIANKRTLTAELVARLEGSFTAAANAKESLPHVLDALESKLADAAVSSWAFQTKVHNLSHIVQALISRLDSGEPLEDSERKKILQVALDNCQGHAHQNEPLMPLFDALENASSETEAVRQEILSSIEAALAPSAPPRKVIRRTPPAKKI